MEVKERYFCSYLPHLIILTSPPISHSPDTFAVLLAFQTTSIRVVPREIHLIFNIFIWLTAYKHLSKYIICTATLWDSNITLFPFPDEKGDITEPTQGHKCSEVIEQRSKFRGVASDYALLTPSSYNEKDFINCWYPDGILQQVKVLTFRLIGDLPWSKPWTKPKGSNHKVVS